MNQKFFKEKNNVLMMQEAISNPFLNISTGVFNKKTIKLGINMTTPKLNCGNSR